MPAPSILALHAGATCMMAGLIWFVQVVHYPLMASVGERGFRAYEERHTRWTTWVVAPLMFVEVGTAAWLCLVGGPAGTPTWWVWLGAALVAVNWLSTALLQVPCHSRLAQGFDEATWRRLVATNWIRTAAWTARVPLALLMLSPDV